jgi:Uri superfamily endonuclease
MKGSYVLIINLENDKNIQVGKLGKIFFKKGYYAYVGSALNNLDKRIERHLRKQKKFHWHIDYLLAHSVIIDVYYKETNKKDECEKANIFTKLLSIEGFGCSDCKCKSHLFYGELHSIMKHIIKLNMEKYLR